MNRKHLLLLAAGLMPALLSAQTTLLADNFDGTSLDSGLWIAGGWGNRYTSVAGGELAVGLNAHGSYNKSFIQSTATDFDFFGNTLEIDWNLGASGIVDDPFQAYVFSYAEVRIGWGISGVAGDAPFSNSTYTQANGLFLGIRIVHDGAGYFVPKIMDQAISAVPTSVNYLVDDTSVTVTLAGAAFASSGESTATFAHGKTADNFTDFYLTDLYWEKYNADGPLTTSFASTSDSIAVSSNVPEPATFALLSGCVVLAGTLLHRRNRGD